MSELRTRTIETNGVKLQIQEQGEGPLVVLLHGFPESSYSWRHQLGPIAAAGYHVVAPNQRGYAHSDAPAAVEAYDQIQLAGDVAGLIEALGAESAVVIGHDWGAPVAWHSALLHPDRVRAVGGLSVPHGGRPRHPPLDGLKAIFKDIFFYILYFQKEGVAEAELEADVKRSLRMFYYSASGEVPEGGGHKISPPTAKLLDTMVDGEMPLGWLSEAELAHYVAEFEQSGFRGPLNWYRNFNRTWELTPQLADAKIDQPALFIAGSRDPVIRFSAAQLERMPGVVTDLRENLIIEGAGHWIQQEAPQEVNRAILDFLSGIDG